MASSGPSSFFLDKKKTTELLEAVAGFKLGELAPSQDLKANGLDKPQARWRMALESGEVHELYIGRPLPDGW